MCFLWGADFFRKTDGAYAVRFFSLLLYGNVFLEKRTTEGSGLVSHYEQKRRFGDIDKMSDNQADTVYGKCGQFLCFDMQ